MTTIIDNIDLDETNIEFNQASELAKDTNKFIYLTGKAGTGKTTFLKYLKQTTTKNTVILAPTAVAAINAGGQTIHSFFQIKPSVYVPNDKRLRIKADSNESDRSTIYDHFKYFKERLNIIIGLELLIIDEISMVRCDLLDVIDTILRVFRKNSLPFGGVQVILIGDAFQLPPIAKPEEWGILQDYYKSSFFFSAKVVEREKLVYIELKKIYRQNEQEFIDLLNKVRVNQITKNDLNFLNSKYNPTFTPKENANYITLATHNQLVDNTNLRKLNGLPAELKSFEATITGLFPDNIMPTNRILQIKENAQIMFIKNDPTKRYYSGKIAKIKKIEDQQITIFFSDGKEITIEKQEWTNIQYTWNQDQKRIEEEVLGTFTQFPIKLAWAITVHKSQGLTFDKVIADLGSAFAPGQVYVALSRCTTFSGLILKSQIEQKAIKTDAQVLEFAKNETPRTLIITELNSGRADSIYKKVRENIRVFDFVMAYNNFIEALRARNDIETDVFKKYFIVTALRLASYKQKLVDVLLLLEKKEKINKDLEILVADLRFVENNLRIEINNQNNATRLLLNVIKGLEKQDENKTNELIIAKKNDTKSSQEIQQLKKNIYELEIISKIDKQEIERLKSLKWYQKLFGQK